MRSPVSELQPAALPCRANAAGVLPEMIHKKEMNATTGMRLSPPVAAGRDGVCLLAEAGLRQSARPSFASESSKKQVWTGRSTLKPARRPALHFYIPWAGENRWETERKAGSSAQ